MLNHTGTLFLLLAAFCTPGTAFAQELLRVDFESTPLGEYGGRSRDGDWAAQAGWSSNGSSKNLAIVDLGGNRALQVMNPEGLVHSSGNFYVHFPRSYEALYLSFRVMFHKDFYFTLGGKLPRLQGGSYKACVPPTEGFSAAVGWNAWDFKDATHGWIKPYVYHLDQPGDCGQSSTASDAKVEPGKWITVETYTQMNTVGKADGVMKIWVDGELAYERSSYRFRDAPTLAIERLMFLHGFGGKDTPEWWPVKDEYTYFDDFVISTEPIGRGNADAGISADSGVMADSGLPPDTHLPVDGGVPADSGLPPDTHLPVDGGINDDSLVVADEGAQHDSAALEPDLQSGAGCRIASSPTHAPATDWASLPLLALLWALGRRRRGRR